MSCRVRDSINNYVISWRIKRIFYSLCNFHFICWFIFNKHMFKSFHRCRKIICLSTESTYTVKIWQTINFHNNGINIVITVLEDNFHKVVWKLTDIKHTKKCSSRSFTWASPSVISNRFIRPSSIELLSLGLMSIVLYFLLLFWVLLKKRK